MPKILSQEAYETLCRERDDWKAEAFQSRRDIESWKACHAQQVQTIADGKRQCLAWSQQVAKLKEVVKGLEKDKEGMKLSIRRAREDARHAKERAKRIKRKYDRLRLEIERDKALQSVLGG